MTAKEYKNIIDSALEEYFKGALDMPLAGLAEAMRYSLLAGGKRIRPTLVLEFCRICGGDTDSALPVACAVEMLHTYSLIHDDLPCMDDDDLRRGRPTNHVVFGECTATLAGDALQAEAFGTILRCSLPADRRARCAAYLADAVGLDGMCGGQFLDMAGETKVLTEEQLSDINSRKTGALLIAACRMGVAAGGGSDEQLEAASLYGAAIGAAFQIRDDMLDVLGSEQELGKPIGSDRQEEKNTYMALLGAERCAQMIAKLTGRAKEVLQGRFDDSAFLCDLADSMAVRTN
ncbi:MAG: polyprenyl synthetase family protein [Oscillospiraceae bacterium]|nr:polyprenyl synthetase family protein [Oscillospiraceae bacterium]